MHTHLHIRICGFAQGLGLGNNFLLLYHLWLLAPLCALSWLCYKPVEFSIHQCSICVVENAAREKGPDLYLE